MTAESQRAPPTSPPSCARSSNGRSRADLDDPTGEIDLDRSRYLPLLDLQPGRPSVTDVKAVKRSDSLAEATAVVRTQATVSGDAGGVGRLLAAGETATVSQEVPIRLTFGVDGDGGWRPGELTAEPKALPVSDSFDAEAHVGKTVRTLFNWTLPGDKRYKTAVRRLFATAPNSESKDYEGEQAPQSPPEIGGDETTTTLGGLDPDLVTNSELGEAGGPDLLDDFLFASDGTEVPSDGCMLNLSRLKSDGPEPPIKPETPGRQEDANLSNSLTETLVATGTVDVTATGYECGSADPSATNTLNFRVDATRVRADGAPWKTTAVELGTGTGEPTDGRVYEALELSTPSLDPNE